jgi:hypothetical protein
MKSFSKIVAIATGLTFLAFGALSVSPALAESPGQLEGGSVVYEVKDVTSNGSYANTISANKCDELEYSIELDNDAYGSLSDVTVKANLPTSTSTSNTSTFSATTASGGISGTTGSTTVNLSSAQSISYVPGTTELFNSNGTVIETIPDTNGIFSQNGFNIGDLNGSTTEFINFKAKVSCPTVVTPPAPCGTCNLLSLTGTEPTYTAAAHYTVTNGASVKGVSFNWGDGTTTAGVTDASDVVTSAPHTYTAPGTYKVIATVTFNSTGAAVANSNCSATVTIPPVTPAPCGTCNLLSLTGTEPTFTANAHYTVSNGASVKGASFNWGDGTTTAGVTNANGVVSSAAHTYTIPGTYTVVATVTFNSTGAAVANSNCSATVTIPTTPTPPVTPPATLVNTGPGSVIGLFSVTTIVGAVAHRLVRRRFARG